MVDVLRDAPAPAAFMIVVGGGMWIAASVLRGWAYYRAANEGSRPKDDARPWLVAEIVGAALGSAGLVWYVFAG